MPCDTLLTPFERKSQRLNDSLSILSNWHCRFEYIQKAPKTELKMLEKWVENNSQDAIVPHDVINSWEKRVLNSDFFAHALCHYVDALTLGNLVFRFSCQVICKNPYYHTICSTFYYSSECRFCRVSSTMSPDLIFLPKISQPNDFSLAQTESTKTCASHFLFVVFQISQLNKYYIPLVLFVVTKIAAK